MASPNATFTELVSTTLRHRNKKFADNVSKNNALYARLYEKGNVKEIIDGGYSIMEELEYAENSTFQYYSGYDTLDVSASDVLSSAEFQWKQAAVHVTANGLEIRSNAGEEKMINLVKSRVNVAMKTMANQLNIGMYSDGTGSGGKQIGGLQSLISDAGTGTVGGIDSSAFTFWKNIVQSAAAPLTGGAITPSKTTIKGLMNGLWYALTRGADLPDLIVADTTYYGYYEESLQDLQRFTNEKGSIAKYGFDSLKYKSADVVLDNTAIPSAHMYFMNTDYIKFKVHAAANMKTVDEKISFNQDAVAIPVIFQGNLTVSNRALQGVLKA